MDPYGFNIPIRFTVTNDGKVGIGTTQPIKSLQVMGDIWAQGDISACNIEIRGDTTVLYTRTSNTEPFVVNNTTDGTAFTVTHIGIGSNYPLVNVQTSSGRNALFITPSGNIGMGTTLPTANLQLVGSLACTSLSGDASAVTGLAPSAKIDTTNATNITTGTLLGTRVAPMLHGTGFTGNVGVGTTQPVTSFAVRGSSDFAPPRIPQVPLTTLVNTLTSTQTYPRLAGVYRVSSSPNSFNPQLAFDNDSGTQWTTGNEYNPTYANAPGVPVAVSTDINGTDSYVGHYIQFECPTPMYLYSYSLTSHAVMQNSPGTWYLLGSTQNPSLYDQWTRVHTVNTHPWTTGTSTPQSFFINSQTPYRWYRIVVNRVASTPVSASYAAISQWNLFGDTVPYEGMRITGPLRIGEDRDSTVVPWFTVNSQMTNIAGNVGIGTTNPLSSLHVHTGKVRVTPLGNNNTTQSLSVSAVGELMVPASDQRLKKEIEPITYGLKEILELNPVHFRWKDEENMGSRRESGLIAQEVQRVMPEMVTEMGDGTLSLDYVKLVPVLIRAIQDLASVAPLHHA